MIEAEKKNWIMCASTGDLASTGDDSRDPESGLCGNHAYSLLAAYALVGSGSGYRLAQEGEKADLRLVKIRNPWGKGEWSGEWSDSDSKWTPQLRTLLGSEE